MRTSTWLGALAVALALAGTGSAQAPGTYAGNSPQTTARTGLTKATGGTMGIAGFMQRIRATFSTRQTSGYSSVPDPTTNKAGYLAAFGYKKL